MKNKSIVNFNFGRESFFDIAAAGRLKYGLIFAESYWKRNKAGEITESTPATSEILRGLFFPFFETIGPEKNKAAPVMIGRYNTGVKLELLTYPGGVNVERIVYKPAPLEKWETPEFVRAELIKIFNMKYCANDAGT